MELMNLVTVPCCGKLKDVVQLRSMARQGITSGHRSMFLDVGFEQKQVNSAEPNSKSDIYHVLIDAYRVLHDNLGNKCFGTSHVESANYDLITVSNLSS